MKFIACTILNLSNNQRRHSHALGKNKLKVSALGLGCMGFTQSYPPYLPENEASFVLQQAVDLGINFFDITLIYIINIVLTHKLRLKK